MLFFDKFEKRLKLLKQQGAKMFSIGHSVLGRDIWCLKVGNKGKKVIIQYAIHAREHITMFLSLLHIQRLLRENIDGEIYFVPLVNPDGVSLCFDGLKSVPKDYQKFLLSINGSDNFDLWKANANAVDLNVNFDAKWGTGKSNVFKPAPENYVGKFANSEPETRALIDLTLDIKPSATISYHCKGEVIYHSFGQKGEQKVRDNLFAKEIAGVCGYQLANAKNSVGGYKDWCVEKLKIPALTIEVGQDGLKHPLRLGTLPNIWQQNRLVPEKTLALCYKFGI